MSYLTVREALAEAAEMLHRQSLSLPRLDAEVLLAHILGITRTELFIRSADSISQQAAKEFSDLIQRRIAREPVAYITGEKEFMSLPYLVNRDVLIPRPETEILVEWIIEQGRKTAPQGQPLIIDVGTGSGAIAVSLCVNLLNASVWGVDLSDSALSVAAVNADRMGVGGRLKLIQSDLLSDVPDELVGKVDIITANLPYIPSGEIPGLMPEVGDYEPRIALDGGNDGLDLYRRLIPQAGKFLQNGGWLGMEIGLGQTAGLTSLLFAGPWKPNVIILRDYAGYDRFVIAQKI